MEFWGFKVKPGESVECDPGADNYMRLSQASLGITKKENANESVRIFLKFKDQKLVLGTLSADKCAQIKYGILFEKKFELSHSSKNASVYIFGYKNVAEPDYPDGLPELNSDFSERIRRGEVTIGVTVGPTSWFVGLLRKNLLLWGVECCSEDNNKSLGPYAVKPYATFKPKVKIEETDKANKGNADLDEDDEDENDDDDKTDDAEDLAEAGDKNDDDNEYESSDEDEGTRVKAETGKKRAAAPAFETPAPEKKRKS